MSSKFHDAASFAGKLTAKRLTNAWTTWYGFHQSLRSKSPFHAGLPWSIAVEPTTSCNLRCPECPSGLRSFTRPTGMMSNDTLARLLEEMHEYLLYMTLYFQGEPYLNPQFFQSVRMANEHHIYTATSTNGHYLTPLAAEETVASGLSGAPIEKRMADSRGLPVAGVTPSSRVSQTPIRSTPSGLRARALWMTVPTNFCTASATHTAASALPRAVKA